VDVNQGSLFLLKTKSRAAFCHCDEVMRGNPAIFEQQDTLEEFQQGKTKTRGFPSPSYDGFGFVNKKC